MTTTEHPLHQRLTAIRAEIAKLAAEKATLDRELAERQDGYVRDAQGRPHRAMSHREFVEWRAAAKGRSRALHAKITKLAAERKAVAAQYAAVAEANRATKRAIGGESIAQMLGMDPADVDEADPEVLLRAAFIVIERCRKSAAFGVDGGAVLSALRRYLESLDSEAA